MDKFLREDKIHEGHRSRMRAKLLSHGPSIFDTYELLEMLLYYVIPYKDTNPISKQLLYRFGSLEGVLSATKEELTDVKGIGERAAEFLLAVGSVDAILGAAPSSADDKPFDIYKDAGRFFIDYFSEIPTPRVALMLLDNNMRCIKTVTLYKDCDYDSGAVKPKLFIDEAISARAAIAITAHSHPRGPLFPTEGDRATNTLITTTLRSIGITHIEHFLVSGNNFVGMMNNFGARFAAGIHADRFIRSKREAIASHEVLDPADYVSGY